MPRGSPPSHCDQKIGDRSTTAVELAQQLKLKGVRCFIFHETSSGSQGYNVDTAHEVFGKIAQITGGALLPFDENSPQIVKQLLEAIALYASQGIKALEQKAKYLPAARLLLEQMKGWREGKTDLRAKGGMTVLLISSLPFYF